MPLDLRVVDMEHTCSGRHPRKDVASTLTQAGEYVHAPPPADLTFRMALSGCTGTSSLRGRRTARGPPRYVKPTHHQDPSPSLGPTGQNFGHTWLQGRL